MTFILNKTLIQYITDSKRIYSQKLKPKQHLGRLLDNIVHEQICVTICQIVKINLKNFNIVVVFQNDQYLMFHFSSA